jgi:hypothetical protein
MGSVLATVLATAPGGEMRMDDADITDDRLLDFAGDHVDDYSDEMARERLIGPYRGLYRNHLLIAHHLEAWAARHWEWMERTGEGHVRSRAFENGLLEVAAHLRLGNYLPGGHQYDTMLGDVPE